MSGQLPPTHTLTRKNSASSSEGDEVTPANLLGPRADNGADARAAQA